MKIIGGDFNAEVGPGEGLELSAVGHYTLSKGNCRGEWMTQWLLQNKLVALNTLYKKIPQKQVTYCTSKDVGKQLDYILTDRKHYKLSRDASDTIHMGSDHRCVMARFEIPKEKEKGKPRKTKAPVTEQQSGKSDDEKQQKYLELSSKESKRLNQEKTQRERLMKKTRQVWQQRTKRQKRKKTKGRQKQTRRQHQRQRQQLTKEPSKDVQQHWKENAASEAEGRNEKDERIRALVQERKTIAKKTKKIESVKSARRSKNALGTTKD